MTFVNEGDFISFRHHVFVKTSHKEVQLAEVGPRFEMRRESFHTLSLYPYDSKITEIDRLIPAIQPMKSRMERLNKTRQTLNGF